MFISCVLPILRDLPSIYNYSSIISGDVYIINVSIYIILAPIIYFKDYTMVTSGI